MVKKKTPKRQKITTPYVDVCKRLKVKPNKQALKGITKLIEPTDIPSLPTGHHENIGLLNSMQVSLLSNHDWKPKKKRKRKV